VVVQSAEDPEQAAGAGPSTPTTKGEPYGKPDASHSLPAPGHARATPRARSPPPLAGATTACADGSSSIVEPETAVVSDAPFTITQTLSDEAQRNTIAFDGLALLTGNLGSQSFLPPGKVADYSGFQFLRDNDPTNLGHNTDFVTIVAFNVLNILTPSQVSQLVAAAQTNVQQINSFAYRRFPLLKAFRRHLEADLPAGTAGLDSAAVVSAMADLYRLDGQISYNRARVMGGIIISLTTAQRQALAALKAGRAWVTGTGRSPTRSRLSASTPTSRWR
jgi:hypothetical protein